MKPEIILILILLILSPIISASISSNDLTARGKEFYNEGRYTKAIASFNEVLEEEPNNTEALFYLGWSRFYLLEDMSPESWNKASNFDNLYGKLCQASIYLLDAEYDSSIKICDELLNKKPKNIDTLFVKGMVLCWRGGHEEAIEYFDKILEIEPYNSHALIEKIWIDFNWHKYDEAIRACDRALDKYPEHVMIYHVKAYAYKDKKLYSLALETTNKSLEIEPNFSNSWDTKGVIYNEIGKYDLAISCFNKSLDIYPKNSYSYARMGASYFYKSEYIRYLLNRVYFKIK